MQYLFVYSNSQNFICLEKKWLSECFSLIISMYSLKLLFGKLLCYFISLQNYPGNLLCHFISLQITVNPLKDKVYQQIYIEIFLTCLGAKPSIFWSHVNCPIHWAVKLRWKLSTLIKYFEKNWNMGQGSVFL
jgi:hypothetical protein